MTQRYYYRNFPSIYQVILSFLSSQSKNVLFLFLAMSRSDERVLKERLSKIVVVVGPEMTDSPGYFMFFLTG
ncbi:MAG: hypothetical protein KJ995_02720, partial [Candidatus Omnitrophica bacterium]|nr:hypothetical protein [Candidatus Omnitrophota bacterium]MBU1851301.1 hypothetical protein [Candidatus Omnitrophota bacterium]